MTHWHSSILCDQLDYPHVRLLVVDNASCDDSIARIRARFPQVEIVANEQNLGFAGGVNIGMQRAFAHGAEYVLLANNDTLLAPDALRTLIDTARATESYLAAPAIFYADQPNRVWSLGGWRRTHLLEIRPAHQRDDDAPFAVDFLTGCGMLLHRTCFARVGLFDERFFMYYEDMDYCLRACQAGCTLIVVPAARMWHKVATSIGGSDSPAERYHMAWSSVQFFRKHVKGWNWMLVAPYRAMSAARTTLRLLRSGKRPAAVAYLRGLWDGARA